VSCAFCDIIHGLLKAYPVYEDDATLVFLDYRPLLPGHCLVVPKTHYAVLQDLPAEEVGPYFQVVQRVATAVEAAFDAEGAFMAANIKISQSVPHLHVHVVPRRKGDGLFSRTLVWKRSPYASEEAILEAQSAIRSSLSSDSGFDPR
jgi:histidine triad (HIT) family protein